MRLTDFVSAVLSVEGQTLADALDLLSRKFGISREEAALYPEREIDSSEAEGILRRLRSGEPSAYIVGTVDFAGVRIRVAPPVLIPRPETEEMVSKIIESGIRPSSILDICTGSGCIAIALSHAFPQAMVLGTDISETALSLARESALDNGSSVVFEHRDFLDGIEGTFDLVVSNPPYIPSGDTVDADMEDPSALFSGADGLDAMRRIAIDLFRVLAPRGIAVFEIYPSNAGKVMDLLGVSAKNSGRDIETLHTEKDLEGRDRFVRLRLSD